MKTIFSTILMAAVLFAACTKDNAPLTDQIVTINATIAGNTKIALGEENEKKVNWIKGDIINLTINEAKYSFTWKEGTTFTYERGETLPVLIQGTVITATYDSAFETTQTGLKDDLGNYMTLSAEKTVTTEQNYGDLNLAFSHETSILKLTLSNDDFKNSSVTDITIKAGAKVVATATETFMGDMKNGSVTVYLVIQPGSLQDVTILATCASKEYTATLTDKSVISGKLYNACMEMALSNDYIDEHGVNYGAGVKIYGVVWAPVNCGYHPTDYPYGKLYQWGRKYGQGYGKGIGYDGTYNVNSKGPVSLSEGQSNTNAYIFYYNSTSPYDWLSPQDDKLWNSGTEDNPVKTEYDPCPDGWRVPICLELSRLINSYSSWATNSIGQSGCWFNGLDPSSSESTQLFFPAAGTRSGDDGFCGNRDHKGIYWSSRSEGEYSSSLYLVNNYITMGQGTHADGFSVRCVRE